MTIGILNLRCYQNASVAKFAQVWSSQLITCCQRVHHTEPTDGCCPHTCEWVCCFKTNSELWYMVNKNVRVHSCWWEEEPCFLISFPLLRGSVAVKKQQKHLWVVTSHHSLERSPSRQLCHDISQHISWCHTAVELSRGLRPHKRTMGLKWSGAVEENVRQLPTRACLHS